MVFDFYACEKIIDLRGHNSKVRSLYWGADDATLISCGQDGAVYQWDWADGKRSGEFVQKGTVYNCALGTNESVFAVGSDHIGLSTTCHLRLSAHVGEIVGKAVVGAGVVGESVGPGVGFAVGDGVGSGAARDGRGVGPGVGRGVGLRVGSGVGS